MGEEIHCKQLKATYSEKNGVLSVSKETDLDLSDGYHIKIVQIGIRIITVSNDNEVNARKLYAILTLIERLLMLFDGKFFTMQEMKFAESQNDANRLDSYAINLKRSRLSYFESDSTYSFINSICSYDEVLTADLYEKWVKLVEELDISHQVYLYSMSANGTPVDLKVAFLIELAEPLVELVKKKTGMFQSLSQGVTGTTLKKCLCELIKEFGTVIFSEEMRVNEDRFLQILVNSRVRIMHIKKSQNKPYLNGAESIFYIMKISMMYRYVLLTILGIDDNIMVEQIKKITNILDTHDDTLRNLLLKIR